MADKVRRYAQDTKVPVGISRDEIERLLRKAGAGQIYAGTDTDDKRIVLGFKLEGRHFKITTSTNRPTRRCDVDQLEREAWRSLLLRLKAKLESVADGSSSAEEEFLAHLLLPDGSTVGDQVLPKVAAVYDTGVMPAGFLGA